MVYTDYLGRRWPSEEGIDPMPLDIAKTYFVDARRPDDGRTGFLGHYGFPGRDKQIVRDKDGRPVIYPTREAALGAAGQALCAALNGRFRQNVKHRYIRLTGPELAVMMANIPITPSQLARLWGTYQKRVMKWIDGEEDIPHPIRIFLLLLTMQDAFENAMYANDQVIVDERKGAA